MSTDSQTASAPVLTPEHMAQISAARKSGAAVRHAAVFAKVDGWTTGIFGALTLILSIGSIPGMLLGAGMAILGLLTLKAAEQLRKFDSAAPWKLARNQLILGAMLLLYGVLSLISVMRNPAPLALSVDDPQLAEMLGPYESLAQSISIAVYVCVIAVAIVGPGLTSLYYLSRRKRLEAYLNETPAWIAQLQRSGMSI